MEDQKRNQMREFKFRAWDINANFWMSIEKIPCFTVVGNIPLPDSILLEQYTGLKDRNSQDIYEGDIITAKDVDQNPNETNFKIIWEYGAFLIRNVINSLHQYPFYKWKIEKFEIIGNIHQNPELLNGTNS